MKRRGLRSAVSFLLSFVLVLGMCMAVVPNNVKAADGDVVFTVSSDKQVLHRGDTVTVTVSMAGNTEAFGLQYDLSYDTDRLRFIRPASDDDESMFGDVMLNTSRSDAVALGESGGVIGIVVGRVNNPLVNGSVAMLPFEALEDASAGDIAFTSNIIMSDGGNPPQPITSYSCVDNTNLKVTIPATAIALNKTTADIAKGQTEQLTATLTPAGSNSEITWKSSDESVASVNGSGLVTAKKAGKATITATAEGKSASCTVNVTIPLNKITIQGTVSTIKKGQTTKLSVVYDPEDTTENKAVT